MSEKDRLGNEKEQWLSWASENNVGDGKSFTDQENEGCVLQQAKCQDSAHCFESGIHSLL